MKWGQAWSVDAIVGVFLFVIIIISVIAFSISRSHVEKVEELKEEGESVFSKLSTGELKLIQERKVDPEKLEEIKNMSYSELKQKLGLRNDFCIYFVDESGNLIYLDESGNVVGIGSPRALINGLPCNGS
ncbi:hypothetical protein DRJ48_04115 [Candidatus Woesearchaeota archaeon]|nr:MAG: hypothetical protein DRJ48_04115 [Candidatus Woesearchaeota archaeon]